MNCYDLFLDDFPAVWCFFPELVLFAFTGGFSGGDRRAWAPTIF